MRVRTPPGVYGWLNGTDLFPFPVVIPLTDASYWLIMPSSMTSRVETERLVKILPENYKFICVYMDL
jgi:hypothetical protein